MKIFSEVCKRRSVTKAAEALGITQPAVSLCVKDLERYYDVRLFDRISHRLYLTAEGEKLLVYAHKIIAMFDEAESEVKNWHRLESLRVGSSVTIGTRLMPGYVKKFSAAYPGVHISVTVDNSFEIEKKIINNELDFAMIEGTVHSVSIAAKKFKKDTLVLVCGPESAWACKTELRPEDLGEMPFLLREKGSGARELFDSTLFTHGITVKPEWESISTEAIISAVESGAGCSVLPLGLVERELRQRRLLQIPINGICFERYFYIIRHRDKHLSKAGISFFKENGLAPV